LSSSTRDVRLLREERGSMSERRASRLEVSTRLVRCGVALCRAGAMCAMRLRARSRVRRRGERGMLERDVRALSVRSIASWSCYMRFSV